MEDFFFFSDPLSPWPILFNRCSTFGVLLWVLFLTGGDTHNYFSLLLKLNLQRAFCSVSLPRKWQRHHRGMLCEDEPLVPSPPAVSLHTVCHAPRPESLPGSRLPSSLNDSEDSLSPLLLTFLSSLDSLYWAKLPFHTAISVKLVLLDKLKWRPETSWK